MATLVFFGNVAYDLDTKEGNKAFVKAMKAQSMLVPSGIQDLMFMSIMGTGKALKKKRRFDDGDGGA